MILVDTSIWIDHLHSGDSVMEKLLDAEAVMHHPFVFGEIALGPLKDRPRLLARLRAIAQAPLAMDSEVQSMIEVRRLHGSGIGYIDAHLVASVLLGKGEHLIWTRDRRLHAVAEELRIDATSA